MVDNKSLSLRERKHVETRMRIQEAAVSLAIEDGVGRTTIDAISTTANISPRTFFNYFDSKEDAILGIYPVQDNNNDGTNGELELHDDVVNAVVKLLFDLFDSSEPHRRLWKKRVKLIRNNPVLLERQMLQMTKINNVVNSKVKAMILKRHPEFDEPRATEDAEVIVMTCAGGVRIAMKEWLSEDDSGALTDTVKQRAITVIKQTKEIM